MRNILSARKFSTGRWGVHLTNEVDEGFIPANTDSRKLEQVAWIKTAMRLYPDLPAETREQWQALVADVNAEYTCLTSHASRRAGDPLAADMPDKTGHSGGWCFRCPSALPSSTTEEAECECSESYRHRGEHTPGCPADTGETQ